MNRVYDFAIRLQDLVSPTLARVSSQYSGTVSRMQGMTQRFKGMFRGVSQSVEELGRKLNGLTGNRVLNIGTGMVQRAIGMVDTLKNKLKDVASRLAGGGGEGGGSGGGLMALARGALPALGIGMALAGAGHLATMGMDREQTKVAFEQFVGKDGINPLMAQMNKFADVTPYSNEDIYGAGRTLLAAKVNQTELQEKMTNIGNMAAVSQKDFGELSGAYAKIKAKGFIDSGELHQEFGGTMLMDELKKQMKVDGEGLFKMAEKRQIRFEDVDKAMASLSAKGGAYNGGLDKLSQTAGGKWSTFTGTLENKITELAEKLNPMLGGIFDFGTGLISKIDPVLTIIGDAFSKLWDAAEPLRTLFGHIWEALSGMFDGIGGGSVIMTAFTILIDGLATVLWVVAKVVQLVGDLILWMVNGPIGMAILAVVGITAAWWLFNLAMSANPIGIVIVALTALVGGLRYAWDHVDGFRYAIIRMWEVAKSVFGSLGTAWEALKAGDFSGLKAALAQGWADGLANADKAIAADKAARAAVGKQGAPVAASAGMPGAKPGATPGAGAGGKKPGTVGDKAGLSGTTGGTKSTNITINVGSLLNGGVTINASGIQDGIGNMEALITDALIRVLNSSNAMATT